LLAAVVGSLTPIDDIGKMVNIGTLLGFRHRLYRGAGTAAHRSGPASPFPHAVGPSGSDPRRLFNGYMMYKLGWVNWARLIVWLVIGLGRVLLLWQRKHSRV
jgi:APA family basic amino acid/polyamine antiporter